MILRDFDLGTMSTSWKYIITIKVINLQFLPIYFILVYLYFLQAAQNVFTGVHTTSIVLFSPNV